MFTFFKSYHETKLNLTMGYIRVGNLTEPGPTPITQTKDPNPKDDPTVLYSGWAKPDPARVLSEPDQIFLIF